VHIAPLAYIGPNVTIGSGTVIYPNVSILSDVQIGKGCVIYPNVSIRENCRIGDRVILQNGCVIGSDGFGHAPYEGAYIKIPQIGNVIIEDDVEIGANTTVDRATLGSTIIRKGTKLDNLVQIAHNVTVGAHTVMAAQSGIAGSTELADHVTIGGQAAITGHIKIGHHAVIAAQSGVTKTLNENAVVWGTPAFPLRLRKKIDVSLKHLPGLLKRIQKLEEEIQALNKQTAKNETNGE
jgi:UDP-3-O-[3-hydroxymyristoyl] glucosamine N-acyltransferase